MLDARMFPGNSGGPVLVMNPLARAYLDGLVSATNRGLDYAIATPVSQIAETLDRVLSTEGRFEAWHKLEMQVAQK